GQKLLRRPARRSGPELGGLLAAKPGRNVINEYDSKRLVSAFGVPVTRESRVATLAEAASAARGLGYPVALKALSDDIPHKTELGLVATNLKTEDDLRHAFAQLSNRLAALDPQPPDCAFLVQEFIAGGIEVFAGVSPDPDFRLSLSFGTGVTAPETTPDLSRPN